MRVLILSADGFEDSELLCPMYRLKEADYQVDIAAPEWGQIKGKRGYTVTANLALDDVETDGFRLLLLPGGYTVTANLALDDVETDGFRLLLLPGGKEASQTLRTIPLAQDIVRSFADKGLPVSHNSASSGHRALFCGQGPARGRHLSRSADSGVGGYPGWAEGYLLGGGLLAARR